MLALKAGILIKVEFLATTARSFCCQFRLLALPCSIYTFVGYTVMYCTYCPGRISPAASSLPLHLSRHMCHSISDIKVISNLGNKGLLVKPC